MAARKRNAEERQAEGAKLIAQKAAMGHGDFLKWVKTNCDYSIATAQRYMREARGGKEQAAPAVDLDSAWAAAGIDERCKWMSKQQGSRMWEELWKRTRAQDEVMKRRGMAKGSYTYA